MHQHAKVIDTTVEGQVIPVAILTGTGWDIRVQRIDDIERASSQATIYHCQTSYGPIILYRGYESGLWYVDGAEVLQGARP